MFRLKEDQGHFNLRFGKWAAFVICLIGLWIPSAFALGTSAGTAITNIATVDYTIGTDPTVYTRSASDAFSVLEVIDVAVTWQDSGNVPVGSPQANAVITFQVTNTGNGIENFRLSADHNLVGDDFNPLAAIPTTLWQESNGSIGLQTTGGAIDTPINTGNSISLSANGAATIYILSNIPASILDTHSGRVRLTADAATAGAAGATVGTLIPGAGVGGDAMVGSTNADGTATGAYTVSASRVTLLKSISQILDPYGGNQPYTSSRVTYRIRVDVNGSGTAQNLVITDAIPANTTYVPGSIQVDGIFQTDADDGPVDNCNFNVTAPNAVTVSMGDTVAPATRFIEFSVTID